MTTLLIRWALTIAMLAAIYRGSRFWLVAMLVMQAASTEMIVLILKWHRERLQGR